MVKRFANSTGKYLFSLTNITNYHHCELYHNDIESTGLYMFFLLYLYYRNKQETSAIAPIIRSPKMAKYTKYPKTAKVDIYQIVTDKITILSKTKVIRR